MTNERNPMLLSVRILDLERKNIFGRKKNMIGFCGGMAYSGAAEDVIDFLQDNRYRPKPSKNPPETSSSNLYFDIRKPLSPEHTEQLGFLCLSLVNPPEDIAIVIDERIQTLSGSPQSRIVVQA